MPSVPRSLRDITSSWLTAAFQAGGCFLDGSRVEAVQLERQHQRQTGIIYQLRVTWSPPSAATLPRQVVVKLSHYTPRHTNDPAREVQLYQRAAVIDSSGPWVHCYFSAADSQLRRYVLLLEDLTSTHEAIAEGLPPTLRQAEQIIDTLAQLHATWWDHPQLLTSGGAPWSAFHSQRLHGFTTTHWPRFVTLLDDRWSQDDQQLCEEYLDWSVSDMAARLHQPRGLTLLHGDAHPYNFYFPRPEVVGKGMRLIDWNASHWVPTIGWGASDLAYHVIGYWPTERRRDHQDKWLQRYHERLLAHGVTDYTWDDLLGDFRFAAIMELHRSVHDALSQSGEFWFVRHQRVVSALHDLDGGRDAQRSSQQHSLPI